MSDDRCKDDWVRREDALRDCGISEDIGQGMTRRIEFHVGYDHRAFPSDCGGGGHGQHGMGMAFLLLGPEGAVQWKIGMSEWTPREVGMLGDLPTLYPQIDAIHAVDLGYHWRVPTYDGQDVMACEYIDTGKCFYDGSGLNAGPVLEKFLAHGPHAVWAELARYYQQLSTEAKAETDHSEAPGCDDGLGTR